MTAPAADRALDSWQLVQRAQAGDSEAFADIYRRYQDTVFRFLYFRTGDRTVSEDITQDTFERALKGIARYEWRDRDLGAWLVTIARNKLADRYKKSSVQREISTGDEMPHEPVDQGREGDPAAAAVDQMRDAAMIRALWFLSEDQRTCLICRFLQEMSIAETAQVMGKDVGAVKALQYRAVRALANHFGEESTWL